MLAMRDDVAAALADGWSVKVIWETLREEGKVDFSYEAFRGHVARLNLDNAAPATPVPAAGAPQAPIGAGGKTAQKPIDTPKVEPAAAAEPRKGADSREVGRFTFDATPKKEDLL